MEFLRRVFNRVKPERASELFQPLESTYGGTRYPTRISLNRKESQLELERTRSVWAEGKIYYAIVDKLPIQDVKQWMDLNIQLAKGVEAFSSLHWDSRLSPDDSTKKLDVALEAVRNVSLIALPARQLERVFTYATKRGFKSELEEYYRITKLDIVGALTVPINGINLMEFINGESQERSSEELFNFFMQSLLIARSGKTIVPEPNSPEYDRFPNTTKFQMLEEAVYVTSAMNLEPAHIQRAFSGLFERDKASAKTATRIIENINESRDQVLNDVLNVNSEEFQSLKVRIDPYFKGNLETRILVLFVLGLEKKNNLIKAFRKSRQHLAEGSEVEFYENVLENIDVILDGAPDLIDLQTIDDLETIFNLEPSPDTDVPRCEDLAAITSEIFKKSSRPIYDINPELLSWDKLVPPTGVIIEFDKGKPKKFTIRLDWENDEGDKLSPVFAFDTSKDYFDWSFIESPGDMEMADFKDSITIAAKNILLKVKDDADFAYLEKHKPAYVPPVEPQVKKKKVQSGHVVKAKEFSDSSEKPKILTPLELVLAETATTRSAKKGVRNEIKIEDKDQFKKLLSRLSHEDQATVTETLEQYSQKGVGSSIKMLKASGPNNETLYYLRISTTAPGGVRVILKESGSGDNVRSFGVLAVGYRKDIYRSRLLNS